MKYLLFISSLVLIYSCTNEAPEHQEVHVLEPEEVALEISSEEEKKDKPNTFNFKGLDWQLISKIKSAFIESLKQNESRGDKELKKFLNDYGSAISTLSVEFELSKYYDTLTQLSYESSKNIYLKAFEDTINAHGGDVKYEEGMLFIGEHGPFILEGLAGMVDSVTYMYASLYANMVDKSCCSDAAIVLTADELVKRVYSWGYLADKSENYAFNDYVSDTYWNNLDLLYSGLDNTPSFGFDESETYREDLYQAIKKELKRDSISLPGEELNEFIHILEKNNFKRTAEVSEYIASRMM